MASIYKRNGKKRWVIAWFDCNGKRREKSSRTTDKRAAERIAAKLEADVALRRDGVVDAKLDHFAVQNRRPLYEHIQDYLAHCQHVGMDKKTRHMKESHLQGLAKALDEKLLSGLDPTVVERHLHSLVQAGRSARTVNHHRADVVALINWCVKTGRLSSNPLSVLAKLDESEDRRRVRRPLTEDELAWLLDVAGEQDQANGSRFTPRKPVYLVAVMTGVRRNEMRQLVWSDADLQACTLRIRMSVGKAKREDVIPLHQQVVQALRAMKPPDAKPRDRIFNTLPTVLTFYKDLERARQKWVSLAQEDAERKRREQSDILAKYDAEGRVVDLHALRTTLGTNLARHGAAPQVARHIMRHSDYKTTLKHYTVLGLNDAAAAIEKLPAIGGGQEVAAARATGTDDATADPPQIHQQSGHETVRTGARPCEDDEVAACSVDYAKNMKFAGVSGDLRTYANQCDKAGERTRTVNIQLGRLRTIPLSRAKNKGQ